MNTENQSDAAALAIVRGELTSKRRWLYRIQLVVVSGVLAALLSLWVTEPRPLPGRLDVMFAAMCLIACGWISVFSWILLRQNCPTAMDRIATSWMALAACSVLFVTAETITWIRGAMTEMFFIGIVAVMLIVAALVMLKGAYRHRDELRKKLHELEEAASSGTVSSKIKGGVVFVLLGFLMTNQSLSAAEVVVDEKATAVIAAHRKACGGEKRLVEITSRRVEGELVRYGTGIKLEILQGVPNRSVTKTFFPRPGTLVQGYDGRDAWILHPVRGQLPVSPRQQQSVRDNAWFDRVSSIDKAYLSVAYDRFDTTSNSDVLRLKKSDGSESRWFFDRGSKFLSRIEREIDFGPRGKATVTVHIEDYRETDGVMFPWKIRTVSPRDESLMVVKRLALNVEVSDDDFKMPR